MRGYDNLIGKSLFDCHNDVSKEKIIKAVEKLRNHGNEIFIVYFEKLSKSEQKHCVRVAKEMENLFEADDIKEDVIRENKELLIKAALLHDVGKIKSKINIIEKSIIVILSKITKEKLKNDKVV